MGSVEISVVCQGFAPLALTDECPGRQVDWAAQRAQHPWAFHDAGSWPWHVHAFAIRVWSGIVMVDTGTGSFPPFEPWAESRPVAQAYAEAGVDPREVEIVVMTHLHADHAGGGLASDGEPRFPNARYVVHPADWAFFEASDDLQDYTARHALERVQELGMLDLSEDDRELTPGVAVVHTPGHTPGHRSVVLTEGDRTVLLTGDLLHLPIQAENPTWLSSHDEDPATGAASRALILGAARDQGWTIGVPHFAEPFGSLTSQRWVQRQR
jgi:glyoxylase-like metal-dependent hydrolase (beta-lactamase superfamily II)